MRRDMDLVRHILREVAESEFTIDGAALATDAHPLEDVAYHCEMMADAGLLSCDCKRAWGGAVVRLDVGPLTWAGNDLLDSIASDTVWSATKLRVSKAVGSTALEVVKAVAVAIAKERLGI